MQHELNCKCPNCIHHKRTLRESILEQAEVIEDLTNKLTKLREEKDTFENANRTSRNLLSISNDNYKQLREMFTKQTERVERLEGALKEIKEIGYYHVINSGPNTRKMHKLATEALKETDNGKV